MFIYLSKKIAIPSCTTIHCVAWNKKDGYLAVGCGGGLLKVLKLDSGGDSDPRTKSAAGSSNLSMNETLDGHADNIRVMVWNETNQRLTTSDESGVIIVWMFYKGTWYEEMINNRKKSTVTGMTWTSDGSKICIVYEDGGIVVGSVDGNRIWGKELKNTQLKRVQWSPDNKLLLFALKNNQLHLYDNCGSYLMQIEVPQSSKTMNAVIVGVDWYSGYQESGNSVNPCLAICYDNGHLLLMKSATDLEPIEVRVPMAVTYCCWNHNGSVLAITGRTLHVEKSTDVVSKEVNAVKFYNMFGELLGTLKVPGNSISCATWEAGSLRIALAVDTHVYFANIRPDYKTCYFDNTLVYAYQSKNKDGVYLCFWNTSSNQQNVMYTAVILDVSACEECCVIAYKANQNDLHTGLMVCNSLGAALDVITVKMRIRYVCINSFYVMAATDHCYLLWSYSTQKATFVAAKNFHVKAFSIGSNNVLNVSYEEEGDIVIENPEKNVDRITCIAASKHSLIIGRESGVIFQFTLPDCYTVRTLMLESKVGAQKIAINANNTRIAVIDMAGTLHVLPIADEHLVTKWDDKLERKDVWAVCWAKDNHQSLVLMEKARMYVFKGPYPEEPISCSGYICEYNDLEIKTVLLDELIQVQEKPTSKHLINVEVKSLRDTKQLLENVNIGEAKKFIEDNPHPRLWRLLADAALKKDDIEMAEFAFIKSQNYVGIMHINKLRSINDTKTRKAYTALFLKQFDEAEGLFVEIDRIDLALSFREDMAQWHRMLKLIKSSDETFGSLKIKVLNNIGDDYMAQCKWQSAVKYYEAADNTEKLIECFTHMDDYEALEKIMVKLPEKHPLLEKIAKKFAAEGVFPQLVDAYEKLGDTQAAKNYCVLHNRWNTAFQLSTKYKLLDIPDLFANHCVNLLGENSVEKSIEINVEAGYYKHAADHTFRLAKLESEKQEKNCSKIYELYVYAGKLCRLHRINQADNITDESPWKGAEAYYFLKKWQSFYSTAQFYNAMCVAYKMQDYVKYLPKEVIYFALALAAFRCQHFGVCSQGFIKLQSLKQLNKELQDAIESTATDIFLTYKPVNEKMKERMCDNCSTSIPDWFSACAECDNKFNISLVTGLVLSGSAIWRCSTCNNFAEEDRIRSYKVCPLCHSLK